MNPLYIVTRRDLPSRYLAPQVAHATADYALQRPEQFAAWRRESQFVVVVEVSGPNELYELHNTLEGAVPFVEPDVGFEMTAFAIVPTDEERESIIDLPLATGSAASIDHIREMRGKYSELDINWTPRASWIEDRRALKEHHGLEESWGERAHKPSFLNRMLSGVRR